MWFDCLLVLQFWMERLLVVSILVSAAVLPHLFFAFPPHCSHFLHLFRNTLVRNGSQHSSDYFGRGTKVSQLALLVFWVLLRTVDNFLEQAISPSLIALMERTWTEQAEARQPCSGEDELEAAQSEMIWATRANGLCSARLYHTISEKICTKTGTTVKRAACVYKTPFAFGPGSPARQGAGHE